MGAGVLDRCFVFSRLLASLLFSTLILAAWATPARAEFEGQRIDKVEIQGLTARHPEQVMARLKTAKGRTYSAAEVRRDLTELSKVMRTAIVRDEPSDKGGVNVTFVVSEFPQFHELRVVGNPTLSAVRIKTLSRLKPGDVLDERVQRSFQRALHNEYNVLGKPQAEIRINLIDLSANEAGKPGAWADVQVVINEGHSVQVQSVIFRGARVFSDTRLKSHLQTKGSLAFVKNYYDDATFEEDLNELRKFYADQGYFDAKVERGSFSEQTVKGKTVVSPVIQITADGRYRFGTATVRGFRMFSQAEVLSPFKPLEGKPFEGKKFAQALDKLKDLYSSLGFLTTEIEPHYDYASQAKVLNMTLEIREKEQISVGKIKLVRPSYAPEEHPGLFHRWYNQFASPVSDETVKREVLLKPGQPYNKRLERETERRLAQLGVFEPGRDDQGREKLRVTNEPTGDPGVHDVVIEAQDAMTGNIMGGVGYGDWSGAYIFASFNERNVHGQADVLSIQGTLGMRDSSMIVSYLDRHFRDGENSLLSQVYFKNLVRTGYFARILGASSEWGHPLGHDWTEYIRGRLEVVSLKPDHEDHDYHPAEDVRKAYGVATARLRFEQDTRYPIGFHAREGYLQSYGVETGYAGGPLLRLEAARDQYLPVTEELTYRLNAFAGLMPYSASTVPIYERYFLGGDTDMRGFKFQGAGYFDRSDSRVPIGGAAKLLAQNELHFPIVDPVSGVGFVDVGTLGKNPASWQAPRASVGTGLRFDLRGVQVALDLALPLLVEDHDQKRYFHFSIQTKF